MSITYNKLYSHHTVYSNRDPSWVGGMGAGVRFQLSVHTTEYSGCVVTDDDDDEVAQASSMLVSLKIQTMHARSHTFSNNVCCQCFSFLHGFLFLLYIFWVTGTSSKFEGRIEMGEIHRGVQVIGGMGSEMCLSAPFVRHITTTSLGFV